MPSFHSNVKKAPFPPYRIGIDVDPFLFLWAKELFDRFLVDEIIEHLLVDIIILVI
jgi:hypothetical protein